MSFREKRHFVCIVYDIQTCTEADKHDQLDCMFVESLPIQVYHLSYLITCSFIIKSWCRVSRTGDTVLLDSLMFLIKMSSTPVYCLCQCDTTKLAEVHVTNAASDFFHIFYLLEGGGIGSGKHTEM